MSTNIHIDHAPVTLTAVFTTASGADVAGRNEITWVSSDPTVVSVESTGHTVTATFNAVGTAAITAMQEGFSVTSDAATFIVSAVDEPITGGTIIVNL